MGFMMKIYLTIVGLVTLSLCLIYFTATEIENTATCTLCCNCKSDMSPSDKLWRVTGYVKGFYKQSSRQAMASDFCNAHREFSEHLRLAEEVFRSCLMSVSLSADQIPKITVSAKSTDENLAKLAVVYYAEQFIIDLNRRNKQVFDKHTAAARVELEIARRKGEIPDPRHLCEIEQAKSILDRENFVVTYSEKASVLSSSRRIRFQ